MTNVADHESSTKIITMELQCTDKRTFELTDHSEKLGKVAYEGLFSSNATAMIRHEQYKITPVGFFSTSISVKKDEIEVANLKMNWKGHIVISFHSGQ